MKHELKTLPGFFQATWDGRKLFELRKDDRGFQVGDILLLQEWSVNYLGRSIVAEVTYILHGQFQGLCDGYVIMAIKVLAKHEEE